MYKTKGAKRKKRDGRKFSVQNIKANFKRAKDKATKTKTEKDVHIQSGIISHVNTDNDLVRTSYPNVSARTLPDSSKYTHVQHSLESVPKRDISNEKETHETITDILGNPEEWVDVFDPSLNKHYEGITVDPSNRLTTTIKVEKPDEKGPRGKKTTGRGKSNKRKRTGSRRRNTGGRGNRRGGRGGGRGRGRKAMVKHEDTSTRTAWTPFNTDVSEWLTDVVSLNRLEAKRKKMRHVCDFLATAGSVRGETLRKKKGNLSNMVNTIKQSSSGIGECFKEIKAINNRTDAVNLSLLSDALAKQKEHNLRLEEMAEDFVAYAKSVENAHKLQEAFIHNMVAHSLELDKRVREDVMRFLAHVPSHKYTDEDHESRVLASSLFQLKEWTAGRYGRPAVGVTTKKTAHVTKFGQLLNMDVCDSYIPCFPDI